MKKHSLLILFGLPVLAMLSACSQIDSSSSDSDSNSGSSSSASSSSSSASSSSSSSNEGHGGSGQGPGGNDSGGTSGGGSSSSSVTYSAVNEYSSDTTESNQTYSSSNSDESAILVNNDATLTLVEPTITKTGDTSSQDNSNFYGQNASVLAMDGATAIVKGGTLTSTDAEGGAGLYAYDTGTVYAQGMEIATDDNCAGGVHVAGGGSLYAWDLSISTQGEHSAAIRSDRGGGSMHVEGGDYVSNGAGSPAIYSTASIEVKGATLTANGSEAASIEGRNCINLFDCDLTGNMSDNSANSDEDGNIWGVILYQSESGDSEEGTSEFSMVGGSLNVKNGGYFYSTNTASEWYFEGVDFQHDGNDSYEYLFRATGSSKWGDGTGPEMNVTFVDQEAEGKLVYDSASTFDLSLTESSTWTGSTEISTDYSGSGEASVYVDSTSKWVLDDDAEIDNLYNSGTIVDGNGNTVSIVSGSQTLVSGTSSYTLTVNGTYSSYSSSKVLSAPSFSEVSKPAGFD